MKTLSHHIKHVQGQPHHIRKRVAFFVAAVGTSFVALIWLVGSLALGNFAIAGSSFADSVGAGQAGLVTAGAESTNPNLAGVGAVAGVSSGAARIEIIDTTAAASLQKKAEQTILPF